MCKVYPVRRIWRYSLFICPVNHREYIVKVINEYIYLSVITLTWSLMLLEGSVSLQAVDSSKRIYLIPLKESIWFRYFSQCTVAFGIHYSYANTWEYISYRRVRRYSLFMCVHTEYVFIIHIIIPTVAFGIHYSYAYTQRTCFWFLLNLRVSYPFDFELNETFGDSQAVSTGN